METKEDLIKYLEDYEYTSSTEMDDVFHIFKSDVSDIASQYWNGFAYVYTLKEYKDFKKQSIQEALEIDDIDNARIFLDELEEIINAAYDFYVVTSSAEYGIY